MTAQPDTDRRCNIYTAAIHRYINTLLAERGVTANYARHDRQLDTLRTRKHWSGVTLTTAISSTAPTAESVTAALYADDAADASLRAAMAVDDQQRDHRALREREVATASESAWEDLTALRVTHGVHIGELADQCDKEAA